MCVKFQEKILKCRIVRTCQSFQSFRQNTRFLENIALNRALSKFCTGFCVTWLVLSNCNKIIPWKQFYIKDANHLNLKIWKLNKKLSNQSLSFKKDTKFFQLSNLKWFCVRNWLLYFGPLAVAGRIPKNRVCLSFCPSFHLSFCASIHPSISLGILLELYHQFFKILAWC